MSAGNALNYHVLVSGLLPTAGAPLPDGTRPRWSPLAHTLIHGPTEAAVVDPPITVAQATALANWIESFGKRLAYVYITHWHADHWLATGELAKRFPEVTVYASTATIDRMIKGTPDVVSGHKDPSRDDSPTDLDETRRYLDDVGALLATGPTRAEFYSRVLERYPERVNPHGMAVSHPPAQGLKRARFHPDWIASAKAGPSQPRPGDPEIPRPAPQPALISSRVHPTSHDCL